MSDTRTTTLQIKAETSGFRNGLRTAKKGLSDFNNEVKKSAAKREAIQGLGNSLGKMGLLAAGGAALAVRAYANFDQAMSAVKATGEDARKSQDALRQAAIDAGQATAFSATESASAIENLAKAGVSAKDILGGGLKGSLSLAAAGGLEVADAAEIASIALTQFKLEGKDVPHVADLLAAGAGKANGEVTDLAGALNQSGLVAAQMGLSIEETTGSLAAFASAGLLGSDAGTSLKTMLLRLQNPSKESAGLMKKLGINAYDTKGNFVGMADLSGQLAGAFEGQTQATRDAAMAQIFGSDAIRAANVLYNQGSKGIKDWTTKVNDAGYAADTAKTKMNNLKGDWEKLTGSLETALIGTGEGADGPLRSLVKNLEGMVNAYNNLPGPAKSATLGILGTTAAIGGVAFVASRAILAYASLGTTLTALGFTAGVTTKRMMLLRTAGIGAIIYGGYLAVKSLDTLSNSLGQLGDNSEAFAGSFDRDGKATAATIKSISDEFKSGNVGKFAEDLGIDLNKLAKDMAANGKQGEYYQEVLAKLGDTTAMERLGQTIKSPFGGAEWAKSGHVTSALEDIAGGLDKVHDKAARAGEDLNNLAIDMLFADGKSRGLAVRLKGLPNEVKTQVLTPGAADSIGEVKKLARQYDLTPDEVRTVMEAKNFASADIKKVLAEYKKVEKKRTAKLDAETADALRKARALQTYLDNMRGKTVTITTVAQKIRGGPHGGQTEAGYTGKRVPAGFASGGIVPGNSPADPREDNVMAFGASTGEPFAIRSGEWIINEKQSQKNDRWLRAINNGLNMDAYMRGYAGGGKVGGGSSPATAPQSFRLASNRITLDEKGVFRLLDTRIEAVNSGNDNYRASKSRAGKK